MSEHIVAHLSGIDTNLGGLIRAVGAYGLVTETNCQPFQALAQAIAHQQLNGIAARTILTRFVNACGVGAFPTPEAVLAAPNETLRAVGFSFSKIAALKDLATKTVAGIVPDRNTLMDLEDAEIIARLTEVRGIGRWTVEMLLMFQLGRPDILPVDDFGVRAGFQFTNGLRKMPAPKVLAAYGERWGPHRTAAAWYLWRAVEMKRAGTLPAPQERIRLPRLLRLRRVARAIDAQIQKAKRRKPGPKPPRAARKSSKKTTSATARRTNTAVRKASSKRGRK
jgi:DNA-3-methyladenine glycosylase II